MIHLPSLNIFNSASPSQNLKRCKDCGEWKDKGEFTGRHARCRACRALYIKMWRANNPEQAAAQRKEYRDKKPEKFRIYRKEYYANNRDKALAGQKKYYANLKAQAYVVLGGEFCVRCGYTGKALQIDHVNGDGFLDRRQTKAGWPVYKKIIATGGAGYQVLCANCNWEKRQEDDERRKAIKVTND